MRPLRIAIATAIALLTLVGPADAISPPPTELSFDDVNPGTPLGQMFRDQGLTLSVEPRDLTSGEPCSATLVTENGHRYLEATCPTQFPILRMRLDNDRPQSWVGFKVSRDSIPLSMFTFLLGGTPIGEGDQGSTSALAPPLAWGTGDGATNIGMVTVDDRFGTQRFFKIRTIAISAA